MKKTGAEIIVESLIEHGVDKVFGYPGGFVINIYDELYKAKDKITHITTCHEQGAAHAADGYARVSKKVGVVIATSGPGATNLITGIAAAYLDSTPMVAITGNVPLDLLGKDSFQEVDTAGITMPITKHNFIVKDINKLAETLDRAFTIATTGRPGPVLVDIPKNIQLAKCEYKEGIKSIIKNKKSDLSQLDKVVELINNCQKPFIYVGGGVVISEAYEKVKELSDLIDAPIGSSIMGLTAFSHKDKNFLGMTGMHGGYSTNKIMAESDLIVAIGARFSDRATGDKTAFCQNRSIIHIDIDPAEIGKNINAEASLNGDVKSSLTSLIKELSKTKRADWQKFIADIKKEDNHATDYKRINPKLVMETIKKYSTSETIVATDVGQHQMWTAQYYKFEKPRTFVTSGGLGAMGFGMGAAIGAASFKGQKTVLITSDGSFHMNLNEMATAVSLNIPLTVIVLNNNALGMVRQWQALFFDKRFSNTTLNRKTDYVALAKAFGANADRVTEIADLDTQIAKALQSNTPYLLEIKIDENERVLPMIPAGKSINDIIID